MLALIALAGSGCLSGMLAKIAVKAPNQQRVPRAVRDAGFAARYDGLYTQQWRLEVGPPAAELCVGVIEPGDYAASYRVQVVTDAKGRHYPKPQLTWTVPARASVPLRGTVLLLHGYMDAKEDVFHWAIYLVAQGYRCVLVDLRGHGRSTGNWVSFGAFDARDLSQLIDDLEKRGLAGKGGVGVLGISYGGSTGLLLAARDPRVRAVVALEPYGRADTALVEFAHGIAPKQAAKISAASFAAAVAKAPRLAGFSWTDADVETAATRITVPVLLFHGARDTWIAPGNSERIYAKLGGKKQYVVIPDDDHISLSIRLASIYETVHAWFETALGESKTGEE
jgi:pimeloyl-ACP methyl ester carboxylesterase